MRSAEAKPLNAVILPRY